MPQIFTNFAVVEATAYNVTLVTGVMVASSIVFLYIAGSLSAYHEVVELTGNAIEDVAMVKRNQNYARRIHRAMSE